MESESSNSPNRAIIGIIVVALLAIAATAVIVLSANNDTAQDNATVSEDTASISPSTSASVESSATFKDGTYSATGNYQTPGGMESIGVKVTLVGGTVTDAVITKQGNTGEAQEYQEKFASGFMPLVVGKKIDEVSLSRVAGSSLTPIGFNDALDDIEKQAGA